MRRIACIFLFLIGIYTYSISQTTYKAFLSGNYETEIVASPGRGEITAVLTGDELVVTGFFSNLQGMFDIDAAGGSHIHMGIAGQDGDILYTLIPFLEGDFKAGIFQDFSNTFQLSIEQQLALEERSIYINIHTDKYPQGEIRGQLLPEADAYFSANLFGSGTTKFTTSNGKGSVILGLSGNELTVFGSFSDLDGLFDAGIAGGAHIHLGYAGQDGEILIPLVVTPVFDFHSGSFEPENNVFILTESQKEAIINRSAYINIHSNTSPEGEIRGQITGLAINTFKTNLSGSTAHPITSSCAHGTIIGELSFDDTLRLSGSFRDLEGNLATDIAGGIHLHNGVAGNSGEVLHIISPLLDPDNRGGILQPGNNDFFIDEAQLDLLFDRSMYINIHSEKWIDGEIRGQLLPDAQSYFAAPLSGHFQNPVVNTGGEGALMFELRNGLLCASGSFNNLSSSLATELSGGIHIHEGLAGSVGNILLGLNADLSINEDSGIFDPLENTFTLSDNQIEGLQDRFWYVNIHSQNFSSGELRGQILPFAQAYFYAPLSAASHSERINSRGYGMLAFEMRNDSLMTVTGSVNDLNTILDLGNNGGAALYFGKAGIYGSEQFVLDVQFGADYKSGTFSTQAYTFSQIQLDSLKKRALYANIFSEDFNTGELRGQILPSAQHYLTSTSLPLHEFPVGTGTGIGKYKIELSGNYLSFSGSFENVDGGYSSDIGSHLHIGGADENGLVIYDLNPILNPDNQSGSYEADDNTFILNEEQVEAVLSDSVYINIHSLSHPSGEQRGQLVSEINYQPNRGLLTSPADGFQQIIEGNANSIFPISWLAAFDENEVVYIWQLSTDEAFTDIRIQQNVGMDLGIDVSYGTLEMVLAEMGLEEGSDTTLYHRILVSDGSEYSVSLSRNIILERGDVLTPPETYTAYLSGQYQSPSIVSQAYGEVYARLDGNDLIVSGYFENLKGTFNENIAGGSHLHLGLMGQSGAIEIGLTPTLDADLKSGTFEEDLNIFTLTNEQVKNLVDRKYYVDIHSDQFDDGEIRGQLLPDADAVFFATLYGSGEVPQVYTSGHGAVAIEVRGDELMISGSFSEMQGDFEGVMRINQGFAGQNGPVLFDLQTSISSNNKGGELLVDNNVFTLSTTELTALVDRNHYVNVHSTAYPDGELRGQILGVAKTVFKSHLRGSNPIPATNSYAQGEILVEIGKDNAMLVSGSFENLQDTLAIDIAGGLHIHQGMAGISGDILQTIVSHTDSTKTSGTLSRTDNAYIISQIFEDILYARDAYVNLHSSAWLSGEIRGQLLPDAQNYYYGQLSGFQQIPGISTGSFGAIAGEKRADGLTLSGSFSNLSSDLNVGISGGVHLHKGMAGQIGGIESLINATADTDMKNGVFEADSNHISLSEAQRELLARRALYLNLHTLNHPSGALRAQLLPIAQTYLYTPLSAASQEAYINENSTGMIIAEVVSDTCMTLSGALTNLSSNIAISIGGGVHIHDGLAGRAGEINHSLNISEDPDSEDILLEASDNKIVWSNADSLAVLAEKRYINVHTLNHMGGELRGQMLFSSTAYFTATLNGIHQSPILSNTGNGKIKAVLNGNVLTLSGSFWDMNSPYDNAIGSHIHIGDLTQTGNILFSLTPSLDPDGLSGIFEKHLNSFLLSQSDLNNLHKGNLYINIHTEEHPSGGLRGQLLSELNDFPSSVNVSSPIEGSILNLSGNANQEINFDWNEATDSDTFTYTLQLSTDFTFSTVLIEESNLVSSNFAMRYEQLDTVLQNAGIPLNILTPTFYRIVVRDGSEYTFSPVYTLNVIRNQVAVPIEFTSYLSGHTQAKPVFSMGSGNLNLELYGDSLVVFGSFHNIGSPVATSINGGSHLHIGYAGQNGPVMRALTATLDPDQQAGVFNAEENSFILTPEEVEFLLNRQVYVNIHSEDNLNGELRGQILPLADEYYNANLFGSNTVPALMSTGYGALALEVEGNLLSISGSVTDLEGDLDLLQGIALFVGAPGENGQQLIGLDVTPGVDTHSGIIDPSTNQYMLTNEELSAIQDRNCYAVAYSSIYAEGEIRGPILGNTKLVLNSFLSGALGDPVTTSFGEGQVVISVSEDDSLSIIGSFRNLSSKLALNIAGGVHLHNAIVGRSGPIVQIIDTDLNTDSLSGYFDYNKNSYMMTADLWDAVLNQSIYINVHTETWPGGEVRGQFLPESQMYFFGHLMGNQIIPGKGTGATGAVVAHLSDNVLSIRGSFEELGSSLNTELAGGIHLHNAYAGSTGPVLHVIENTVEAGGMRGIISDKLLLTESEVVELRGRKTYVNLHSIMHPDGALRAQLLPECQTVFYAPLASSMVSGRVESNGSGFLITEVRNDLDVVVTGSFNGLESDLDVAISGGVHLHQGMAGQNGDIQQVLTADVGLDNRSASMAAANNSFQLPPFQMQCLQTRNIYANIHSLENPSGELRGQMLPVATNYYSSTLSGINEVPLNTRGGFGKVVFEQRGARVVLSGSFDNLSTDFDISFNKAVSLKSGSIIASGSTILELNPDISANLSSGLFIASENEFTFTQNQLDDLWESELSVNIPSINFPDGEIRGHLLPSVNFYPSGAEITAPSSTQEFIITGFASQSIAVSWTGASDDSDVKSVWQLSDNESFDTFYLIQNTGFNQNISLKFGQLDAVMDSLGIMMGEGTAVYHRIASTDGSEISYSPLARLNLVKGQIFEDPERYRVFLNGRNEVFPVATKAFGELEVLLEGNTLLVSGTFEGLGSDYNEAIGSHIHLGLAGQEGAVLFTLIPRLNPDLRSGSFDNEDNIFTLTESQLLALEERRLYINIHSENYVGGELRGQIVSDNSTLYSSILFGSGMIPSQYSNGHGALLLELIGNELRVSGSVSSLDGDYAALNIHNASPGQIGGIEFTLISDSGADAKSAEFLPENNTFILEEDQLDFLTRRLLYANLNTDNFPSGELRGHITGNARNVFRAHLSSPQSVPVTTSLAEGIVLAEVSYENELIVYGFYEDLEGLLATNIAGGMHIHDGLAGSQGDILYPLSVIEDGSDGVIGMETNTFDLNAEVCDRLYSRGCYVNLHSTEWLSGEIRGQLLPEAQYYVSGFMTGSLQIPSVQSTGSGLLVAELNGDRITYSGSGADLSGNVNSATLQLGWAGQNGTLLDVLNLDFPMTMRSFEINARNNEFGLVPEIRDALISRRTYLNIITDEHVNGEIRGQLLPEARGVFMAPLSSGSQNQYVNTESSGYVILELQKFNRLTASGSFDNLQGELSTDIFGGVHIHDGLPGQEGDIVVLLNSGLGLDMKSGVFSPFNNQMNISDGLLDSLRNRMMYINIHSEAFPSGELRGQILPLAENYFTSTLNGIHEVDPTSSMALGKMKFELRGDQLTGVGSFNGLNSDFSEAIGSHLHFGTNSDNGSILTGLNGIIDSDLRGGIFLAENNSVTLTGAEISDLMANGIYANIHTEDEPAGELRGQLLGDINFYPAPKPLNLMPDEGAIITLEGKVGDELAITFDGATDQNDLTYIYQLSATADFSDLMISDNLGGITMFAISYGRLDTILMDRGVDVGVTTDIYHRVIATDGSEDTFGEAISFQINRQIVTYTPEIEFANISHSLIPNLTHADYTTLKIETDRPGEMSIEIMTSQGLILKKLDVNTFVGNNEIRLDIGDLSAGWYLVKLTDSSGKTGTEKLIKIR